MLLPVDYYLPASLGGRMNSLSWEMSLFCERPQPCGRLRGVNLILAWLHQNRTLVIAFIAGISCKLLFELVGPVVLRDFI